MKKGRKLFLFIIVSIIVIFSGVVVLAYNEDPSLPVGQVRDGDFIVAGTDITNEGIVLGDFICAGQGLINTGTVEGDLIAAVTSANILGNVQGSVRVASNDIKISASVERNVMIAANNVFLDKNSVIERNAYIFGTVITSEGLVEGNLSVAGDSITLSGTYEGNVEVDNLNSGSSKFELLPGTNISGKLTYKGTDDYVIPAGVSVGEYEFVQIDDGSDAVAQKITLGGIIRTVITMLIYYLFALLLYKMFPRFFAQSGEVIQVEPITIAGVGIAAFGSLVGGAIILLLLLLIITFIAKLSVFGYTFFIYIVVLVLTGLLSVIPVSLWIGNTVTKRVLNVPRNLAIGLALITVVRLALEYLKTLNVVSGIAGIILFIVNAAIWVFGVGAVIKTTLAIGKAANSHIEEPLEQEYAEN